MAAAPLSRGPRLPDQTAVSDFLRRLLSRNLAPDAMAWLDGEIERQKAGLDERRLGIVSGLVARKLGRRDLMVRHEELATIHDLRRGWQPQFWATDEAARVALLLAAHHGDDHAFATLIEKLCVTAEINEHVSYLKGFAIFPAADLLHRRAREGARSSIAPIFEGVACRNPYAFDYFDDPAWNQMVVKCAFGGTPLESIVGLHQRRNAELIKMLRDLVAERLTAGRPLPAEVHGFIHG